jgi:hypothetical protein
VADWARDGYRVCEQPNGKGGFVLFAEQLKALPDDLPLVIGDAFQCMRNSLDHIVFELSKKETPAMTPEDEEIPQFPFSKRDLAIADANERIRFLSQAARDDVRSLAPDPGRQEVNRDPLWLVNKMCNRDKHREIAVTPVARVPTSLAISSADATDYFRTFGPGRLELGAAPVPLVEFTRGPHVQAQIGVPAKIFFGQGLEVADQEVVGKLREFHDYIRDTVFQRLERHL